MPNLTIADMSYLLIKENDTKIFKAFMSGSEIEIGVVVSAQSDIFVPGEVIDIFYGNNSDTYQAKVVKKRVEKPLPNNESSLLKVSLLKRK
jgi:hypothetical protein